MISGYTLFSINNIAQILDFVFERNRPLHSGHYLFRESLLLCFVLTLFMKVNNMLDWVFKLF